MNKDKKNILIITLSILLIVLIFTRFTNTFGSNPDWLAQHIIFPDYFRKIFYQTGNFLPNLAMNYGGGQNIFNFSYYGLLSPIILPSYLMPFVSMTIYMTIVDILLVISSGILFYKWLISNKYNDFLSLISALIFVLSQSLLFHMHRHIMFTNYMPFLIMSLMGIDKYLKHNHKSFLVINIFLMIMTSYYYSVCGILVIGIYYIYKYLKLNNNFNFKKFINSTIKAILLVLLGVCLSAIILLPTIYTLFSGRGDNNTSYNLINLLMPNLKFTKVFSGTYTIGLSSLGFISLLYMFYTKKRENIISAILSSIILFIPLFRYLLNGGLYLREKCFIPFLPLIALFIAIFLKDLFNNKIKIKNFCLYLLIINIPLYFYNKLSVSYLYLIFLMGLFIFYNKTKNIKLTSYALILVVFMINLITNLDEDYVSLKDYNEYFNKNTENEIINTLNKDNSIYRTNNLTYLNKTVNKIYDYRYYTPNIYSSTYNKYYLSFIRDIFKLNNPDFNYFFVSAPNNILFNTFMGVKYVYSDYDMGLNYNKISSNMYYNTLAYPIIYVNHNIMNEKIYDNLSYPDNVLAIMNNVITSDNITTNNYQSNIQKYYPQYEIIGNSNVLITKENDIYNIKVLKDSSIQIKLKEKLENKLLFINLYGLNRNSCSNGNTEITINNQTNLITCSSWIYHNQNEDFHYLLNDSVIDTLNIKFTKGTYTIKGFDLYTLDNNYLNELKTNFTNINNLNYQNDLITFDINNNKLGYLVTSIPYDEGFTVKVNGNIVDYEMINKAFLGFKLQEGIYHIEISYKSPYLKEGIIISLISLIILTGLIVYDNKKKI